MFVHFCPKYTVRKTIVIKLTLTYVGCYNLLDTLFLDVNPSIIFMLICQHLITV